MSGLYFKIDETHHNANLVIANKIENNHLKPFVIDLKDMKRASLWFAIRLLIIIEILTDHEKYVKIIFPDDKQVRGFLKFIGFTQVLSSSTKEKPQGRFLIFSLSDGEPLPENGEVYKIGRKVFPIMGTNEFSSYLNSNHNESNAYVDISSIREWIDGIEEYINFPLICDGEFLSFFGLQLVKNVEEHAKVNFKQHLATAGYLGIRIVDSKSYKYFNNRLRKTLRRAKDALEVCIGDRGVGITHSLCAEYHNVSLKYGIETKYDENIEENVLAFSVHELGTNKKSENRIGSIHALHRILRSLAKYGGALRILSGGWDMIYDLDPNTLILDRYSDRIGIIPTYKKYVDNTIGTQIQIIVPLTIDQEKQCKIFPTPPTNELFEKNHIIPVITFFKGVNRLDKNSLKKISENTERFSCLGLNQLVVYDFYGNDWKYEDVVFFLSTQADILFRKRCILIGVPEGIIDQISYSEKAFHDILKGNPDAVNSDFFITLCDKHRILPVLTIENKIKFLGFGGNIEAHDLFMSLFINPDTFIKVDKDSPIEIFRKSNDDVIKKKNNRYVCKINKAKILATKSETINENIENILYVSEAWQRKGRYRLPTSNIMVGEFLWTLPVLENLTYNRQIGKWLSEGVYQKFNKGIPNEILMLCVTAPAEMVARSIAKELPDINVYIINLGHFGALDDEGLLTEELLKIPFFIVSDLVREGHSTEMVLKFHKMRCESEGIIKSENGEALGLLSFLHLIDVETDEKSISWIKKRKLIEYELDTFFLAKVKHSDRTATGEKYLIEPFSLKPFKYNNLKSNPSNNIILKEKLKLAEKENVLRFGHWVSGKHHFRVTTCIPKLIQNAIIGGKILRDIGEVCIDENLNHLLVPFHSNIRHIIPKLRQYIAIKIGRTLGSTYSVEARALTNSSFYIQPKQVSDLLYNKAKDVIKYIHYGSEGEPPRPISFLIIDDAIYSARTIETIIRALVRKIKKVYRDSDVPLCHPVVDKIVYYAIIDRKGRAKGTLYESIKEITLFDTNNIRSIKCIDYNDDLDFPKIKFKYHNWVALDMPALSKEDCIYCNEIAWLNYIKYNEKANLKYIADEIDKRLDEFKPYGIESPKFINSYKTRKFIEPFNILGRQYFTLEGALWEIHTRRNRGCPYEELISIITDIKNHDDVNLNLVKVEIYKIIFNDWKKFTANWAHKGLLFDVLKVEIEKGSYLLKKILPEVGKAYATPDIEGRKELEIILLYAVDCVCKIKEEDDLDGTKTDILLKSIELALLYIEHKFKEKKRSQNKIDLIREKIVSLIDNKNTNSTITLMACNELKRYLNNNSTHPFVPSLLFIMDHTVRAIRNEHKHLIPSLLSRFIKSKKVIIHHERENLSMIDIDYFGKMLIYFSNSLNICCQQDLTFQKEIQNDFTLLSKRCHNLSIELNDWKGWNYDNDKDERILLRLNMLSQIFPTKRSEIVDSLEKRLTTPIRITNKLKSRCSKISNLTLLVDKSVLESKAFIIVPSEDIIYSFFDNYIDLKAIKMTEKEKINVYINEKPQHIIFTFETSFRLSNKISGPEIGHGLGEMGTLPFVLYDINHEIVKPTKGYKFSISLRIWKGFISKGDAK
ncbi:hypothetical protein [uncultured Desulfosarcina sp.]|uniref:hypothetical protein n=1 Tax=uncultured Desulfosarcina sp. TaxID=218289 RepID=UPI0029C70057|nr:hypothetical protein [uncultured Desulfosarcina sp.]